MECQLLDWKNHQILCKTFKDAKPKIDETNHSGTSIPKKTSSTSTALTFRRDLLSPGDDSNLRFVWVKTWITYPGYDRCDLDTHLGKGDKERLVGSFNTIQSRPTTSEIGAVLAIYSRSDASTRK
jgi:hypothetical protein